MKVIRFRVIYCQTEYHLETYPGEYRNLMALLNDQICPDYFGVCGGQARCSTCVVTILEGQEGLYAALPAEHRSLDRLGDRPLGLRLSCQVMTDLLLDGALLMIAE